MVLMVAVHPPQVQTDFGQSGLGLAQELAPKLRPRPEPEITQLHDGVGSRINCMVDHFEERSGVAVKVTDHEDAHRAMFLPPSLKDEWLLCGCDEGPEGPQSAERASSRTCHA